MRSKSRLIPSFRLVAALMAGLLLAGLASVAEASKPAFEEVMLIPSTTRLTNFGSSMTIVGDSILVGEPSNSQEPPLPGKVRVFEPDGAAGYVESTLRRSTEVPDDGFGFSMAASGDTLVVGAPFDSSSADRAGAVYVFTTDVAGVVSETRLVPSDAQRAGYFGRSVAVSGATVVVGAERGGQDGQSGVVYVFNLDADGGYLQTRLVPRTARQDAHFGHSVAVLNDTIVVGDHFGADASIRSGIVHLYKRSAGGGYDERLLTSPEPANGDLFGYSVALSDSVIVVGSPGVVDTGPGSVYVFREDASGSFSEVRLSAAAEPALTSADAAVGNRFGNDVAVLGETILVGAPYDRDLGELAGAAHLYEPNLEGGYDETKLTASDGRRGATFGTNVAITDNLIAVVRFLGAYAYQRGDPGGPEANIHELAWFGSDWHHVDVSDELATRPPPATGHALAATMVWPDGVDPQVFYVGQDGHTNQLAWIDGAWRHRDINAMANKAPLALSNSNLSAISVGQFGEPRVYYTGSGGIIHELAWYANEWHHRSLEFVNQEDNLRIPTVSPGSPIVAAASLDVDNTSVLSLKPHVFYYGHGGHVNELVWSGSYWQHRGITLDLDAPDAASDSDLAAMTWGAHLDPRVYYTDLTGQLNELAWHEGGWHHRILTGDFPNSPAPKTASPLAAMQSGGAKLASSNRPHVFYVDERDHINELAWNGFDWEHRDVSAGLPDLPSISDRSDLTALGAGILEEPRVYFTSVDDDLIELAFFASSWHYRNLSTEAFPDVPIAGNVLASVSDLNLHEPRIYVVQTGR